jgi:hypothetical protein
MSFDVYIEMDHTINRIDAPTGSSDPLLDQHHSPSWQCAPIAVTIT